MPPQQSPVPITLGNGQLLAGNALEILPTLPAGHFQLIIADPPCPVRPVLTQLRPTPANAVPSTTLHLLISTRPPRPQANRSTAPAIRSIRFTSLRFHSAQSVSAVQRKRTLIGAALRFAPFAQPCRARGPTDAGPHSPHSPRVPDSKSHQTAHCKPSSTFAGRTRFIPPPLREYAPRSSMKRPATAPEGAERRIKNPTVP